MSILKDLFNPEIMFSKENPLLKTTGKTHRSIFEALDKTARLQLAFAEDLLDLNRKRFNSLYADDSLQDRLSNQTELVTEFGKRTAALAGDLQDVVVNLGSGVGQAANDLMPAAKKPGRKPTKAKAA